MTPSERRCCSFVSNLNSELKLALFRVPELVKIDSNFIIYPFKLNFLDFKIENPHKCSKWYKKNSLTKMCPAKVVFMLMVSCLKMWMNGTFIWLWYICWKEFMSVDHFVIQSTDIFKRKQREKKSTPLEFIHKSRISILFFRLTAALNWRSM